MKIKTSATHFSAYLEAFAKRTTARATTLSDKTLMLTSLLMPAAVALLLLVPLARAQDDVIPEKTAEVAAADTTPPSDVENVKAMAGNAFVNLSWNVATDDAAVKGYKVYYSTTPVTEDGGTYALGPIDVGNKITYQVAGLTNGTTYYFAVTAYDEAGNESDNYSAEVSATPAHAAADTESPKVVKAEAVNKVTVKVTFSEAVSLPAANPEGAFSVKNDATQVALDLTKAEMDVSDPSGKTVKLTTGVQQAGANYIVTAGIQIKDTSGNPIVSGTSDTAVFAGVDIEPAVVTQETQVAADTAGPELAEVVASDPTHVTVKFSEPVKLGSDPTQNFIITEEENIETTLDVLSAQLAADGMTVVLTTPPQKAMSYNLIVVDVTDAAGNLISVDSNATVFVGTGGVTTQETQAETQETQAATQETQAADVTPPEDATNFAASMLSQMVIRLVWAASLNSAGDLANYILYQSTDGATYGPGVLLDAAATTIDVSDLVPGMKYFFKLAARDTTGNESQGVVAMFTLPQTGPELGLLALGSLGLGRLLRRRKKARRK